MGITIGIRRTFWKLTKKLTESFTLRDPFREWPTTFIPPFFVQTASDRIGSMAWRNVVGGSATRRDGHVFSEAEGADFQRDRERAGDGAVQPGSVSALTRHGIQRFE